MTDDGSAGGRDVLVAGGLFIALLALYAFSAPAGVYWGDSAQFSLRATALDLGPGARDYPLHRLLCRGAAVAWGDPASAANAVSWFFGAATVALVHAVARALRCGPAAALAAALVVALAPTFWGFSLVAEVYTLHTTILLATLLAAIRVQTVWRERTVGLALGLSLLHHRLALLTWPALIAWTLWERAGEERRSGVRALAAGLAVGVLPFAVLCAADLARGTSPGAGAWLRDVFLGDRGHALRFLGPDEANPALATLRIAGWTALNVGPVGLSLAVCGLVAGRTGVRGGRALLAGLIAPLLLVSVWTGARGDAIGLLVGAYPLCAVACGLGCDALLRSRPRLGGAAPWLAVAGSAALPVVLGVSTLGPSLRPAYTPQEARSSFLPLLRHEERPAAWCVRTLSGLPPGARVHAEWGAGTALRYLQEVEGKRRDVVIVTPVATRGARVPAGEFVALTPLWEEPELRLPGGSFTRRGEGLFEAR